MKKVVVTGGTGFIGEKLCLELLRRGYAVTILTRDAKRAAERLPLPYQFVSWDSKSPLAAQVVEGAEAVIHLAGESVAGQRWNPEVKKKIHDSRVLSTRRLAEAIDASKQKPKVFIGASGIGIYGNRGAEWLSEASAPGKDFLAQVCLDWEAAYRSSAPRTVILRTGLVLGSNGGALEKMLPPFRFGVGGKIGDGQAWMSWIHLDDLVALYIFALENPQVNGALNAVAPEPVTNAEFTRTLGRVLHRPTLFPVPLLALRLALGESATALLASQRVRSRASSDFQFPFRFPTLTTALNDLLAPLGLHGAYVFSAALWIKAPRSPVFSFFSAAKNLEAITPPWLKFRVLKTSTPAIQQGTLIDYKLLLKGMPIRWRTLIEQWQPEDFFVDRQLRGPYRDWHHTHEFIELAGGTLMTDRVVYQLPLGVLGDIAHALMVKKDVRTIFQFRRSVIHAKRWDTP